MVALPAVAVLPNPVKPLFRLKMVALPAVLASRKLRVPPKLSGEIRTPSLTMVALPALLALANSVRPS